MESPTRAPREVAVPARALATLRASLRREAGPAAAVHALQAAGYDSGGLLYDGFTGAVGGDPAELGEQAFWSGLSGFLSRRGWGTLRHESLHGGLGAVSSADWAEAEVDEAGRQPSCAFSAGLLSHLLSRAAGGPVAVLEVDCRTRGDRSCRFVFGAEQTVQDLYALMVEGRGLEAAMAEL